MYACQFYSKMLLDLYDIPKNIKEGNLSYIKKWLNDNIHKQGRLYSPENLIHKVTGDEINPDFFISYLKQKYGEIYRL